MLVVISMLSTQENWESTREAALFIISLLLNLQKVDNIRRVTTNKCSIICLLKKILRKAGIIAELDRLVKEFVCAGSNEKKAVYAKIEEEIGKLTRSSARYSSNSASYIHSSDYFP